MTPRWGSRKWRWVRFVSSLAIVAVASIFLWVPGASADNCSVFTDCFGQSGAASEAAFGLTFLAALSLVVDFIPIVGDVKGLIELGTGRDLFTGEELAPWERALGLVGLIPGGDLLRLTKGADIAAAGARNVDNVGAAAGLGRGVNAPTLPRGFDPPSAPRLPDGPVGPTPPRIPDAPRAPAVGDVVPHGTHRADIDNLVTQYEATTRTSTRTGLSEQIGELGAVDHLEQVTGRHLPDVLRPTSDADVADLVNRFDDGVAWDAPVVFNGRNVTNIVYYDGQVLHVVEAKGGAGQFGDRVQSAYRGQPNAPRIGQTNPRYPADVAADMRRSGIADGRNGIGRLILRADGTNSMSYTGVRTSGHNVGGDVVTVVEGVFRSPGS